MKKTNVGSRLALYPMPVTVVGTMDGNKPEWLQIDHVGIIGHNRILVSMFQKHHTNPAIKNSGKLSINLVDRDLLPKADYVGSVSGEKVDKSEVFDFHIGEGGTPVIEASPLTMECDVVEMFEMEGFDNFICSISNTYVSDDALDENGHIDYTKLNLVLFEMPTYSYLEMGPVIGKCMKMH